MKRLGLYRCYCTEVADIVPARCEHHDSLLSIEVAAREPVVGGHRCGELMSQEDALAFTLGRDPEPHPEPTDTTTEPTEMADEYGRTA